jgi:hypothetical protein
MAHVIPELLSSVIVLHLPNHVHRTLDEWADSELDGTTPKAVLEMLAEELCSNEQLRAFVAGLVGE